MYKKKILFITSTRADFSLQKALIILFTKNRKYEVYLIVTGSHLSKAYGSTSIEIDINKCNLIKLKQDLSKDKNVNVCNLFSDYIKKINILIQKYKFDLSVLIGDRYEILSAALSLNFNNVPINHLHGGETTLGSKDDIYRDLISKLSINHFVSHKIYKKKLTTMGIQSKSIFNYGAFCSDNLNNFKKKKLTQLSKSLNLNIKKKSYFIFTYHPETKYSDNEIKKLKIILKSLKQFIDKKVIITSSNHDVASNKINKFLIEFVDYNKNNFYFKHSLGSINYLSLISYSAGVIGNSSSGVIEAPFFNIPTINIGSRQLGRYMHLSVINVKHDSKDIVEAIRKSLNPVFISKIGKMKNTLIKKNVSLNCYNKIKDLYE